MRGRRQIIQFVREWNTQRQGYTLPKPLSKEKAKWLLDHRINQQFKQTESGDRL